ncbi:DNA internalization-related competence protein ComEC/Rec2, partial [bacterium]|nr:DNA internalization-related competence protein ComEC/Rec2 [bacterium]
MLTALSAATAGLLTARHALVPPNDVALAPASEIEVVGRIAEVRSRGETATLIVDVHTWKNNAGDTRGGYGGRLWATGVTTAGVRRGDVVRIVGVPGVPSGRRNPGAFDFAAFLRWRGIHRTLRAQSVTVLERPPGPEVVAARIERTIRRHLRGDSAALLRALLLGRTDELPQERLNAFRVSGTVHVLAVSGLHVGFVLLIALALARCAGASPRGAALAALPILVLFAVVVGPRPSVIRAVTMAVTLCGARILNRRTSVLNAVGLAATILLLLRPGNLFDMGFRLSFGAVLSIVLIAPAVIGRLDKALGPRRARGRGRTLVATIGSALAVSTTAQLGTLPTLLALGTPFSPGAALINVVVVPLAGFAVATGAGLCVIDMLCFNAAHLLAAACAGALTLMVALVGRTAESVGAGTYLPACLQFPAAAAVVAISLAVRSATRRARLTAAVALAAAAAAACWTLTTGPGRTHSRVLFFDVGQGDALLVRSIGGDAVLIDAGPADPRWDSGERIILPHLRRAGIRMLDMVIVTHGHRDHTGGVPALIDAGVVKQLVLPVASARGAVLDDLARFASDAGVPVRDTAVGETLLAAHECTLLVLWPPASVPRMCDTENGRSIVLRVCLGGFRIFAGGDIEAASERELCARSTCLSTDLLKVSHHGSAT